MKYAVLRRDFKGVGELVHDQLYEVVDERTNYHYLKGSGVDDWYPTNWLEIVDTDQCRITKDKPRVLKGKVETVEDCIERIRTMSGRDIAKEIVNLTASLHSVVGESAQLSHNLKQMKSEVSKALGLYGID